MGNLLQLDQEQYELVVRWRQRTGSQLAAIWKQANQPLDNHLQVVFGNSQSDQPLETPLAEVIYMEHEADLDARAMELWGQMWGVPHPMVLDFEASRQPMRAVVATTSPISHDLAQQLLGCVKNNVDMDLPDFLLTP